MRRALAGEKLFHGEYAHQTLRPKSRDTMQRPTGKRLLSARGRPDMAQSARKAGRLPAELLWQTPYSNEPLH